MHLKAIDDQIIFMEPDSMANYQGCAGLLIQADLKIVVDINLGRQESFRFLEKYRPDMAYFTHFHLDHSARAHMAQAQGAIVCVPDKETQILSSMEKLLDATARPCGLENLWRQFFTKTLGFKPLSRLTGYGPGSLGGLGKPKTEILATPGHSPGHSSFWFPQSKILFCGDMGIDRYGPWYGWYNSSLPDLVDSICRLRSMNARLLLTSHGGIVKSRIRQAWDKALDIILQREKKIECGLEKGLSRAQLIGNGVFFLHKDKVDEPLRTLFYMWDGIMLDHHLKLLQNGGLARLIKSYPQ